MTILGWIRRVVLVCVGLMFVYQLAASTWRIGRLAVRDLQRDGQFDTEEQRIERAFGPNWSHLLALREAVPENALLYCTLQPAIDDPAVQQDAILLNRLRHALHPRMVYGIDFADPAQRLSFPAVIPAEAPPVFIAHFKGRDPGPPFVKLEVFDGMELWGVSP